MRFAIWLLCDGEAHTNGYQDHCMVCLPNWGSYPVCPDCGRKLKRGSGAAIGRARCTNSACASVRRWFSLRHEPNLDAWGRFALMWVEIGFAWCGTCGRTPGSCIDCGKR